MRLVPHTLISVVAGGLALSIVIEAQSTPSSARSETRIQLANVLLGDQRYWEAISVYDQAKRGATKEQLIRAVTGMLKALLPVAEFTRAQQEAEYLHELAPHDPEVLALNGDALWAGGLFDEAEQVYRDVLAIDPQSGGGRNGLAKSLVTRNQYDEAMDWVQAAIAVSPEVANFYHTLGFLYQRLNRFQEAADAYERYVELLPTTGNTEKADWVRSQVTFLRSFGDRVPVQLVEPGRIHTIPFRLIRDKVIVRGQINGQPAVDFVVDTGAEQTVLSQPVARRMGVQPVTLTLSAGVGEVGFRSLQAARIDSLKIGSLHVKDLPVLIKSPPLGGLPTPEAEAFSPLALGLSTIIDYGQRQLIIGENLPDEPADVVLKLRQYRLTVVRGVVNGAYPRSFVVDTGGEVISISRGTAYLLPPLTVRRVPVRVYGTSGWDEDAYLMPGINLAFNELQYRNFSVIVLNLHRPSALLGFHIGGIIGHELLHDYRVTLDLNRSVMKLKRL